MKKFVMIKFMSGTEFFPDQKRLADALARRVSPESFALDRWMAPVDIRSYYGDEAADEFERIVGLERQLSKEGAFGEYVLNRAGCQPPYEVSVPKAFPWMRIKPILGELKD